MTRTATADDTDRRRVLTLAGCALGTALAGCMTDSGETTPTPRPEATVTVRIRNRDDIERSYAVRVRQDGRLTNEFTGVAPADQTQPVEMVATVRATDARHEVAVETEGGQTGRTWDPLDCPELLVEASIVDGAPQFESDCRSD